MRPPGLVAMGAVGAMMMSAGALFAALDGGTGGTSSKPATVPDVGIAAVVADEPGSSDAPTIYRISIPGLQSDKPSPDPPPLKPSSPTSAEGLRVWAYGDSTSWFATQAFVQLLESEGAMNVREVVSAGADEVSRRGIGLTAGSVDIPAYVAAEMAAKDPDVVVLMFGANDAVGGIDEAAFGTLAGSLMDLLERPGRVVIWIGEPAMTRPDLVPHIAVMNALFKEQATERTWVRYVDAHAITAGRPLAADGVHPTASSGALIAQEAIRVLFGEQ